jgi:hypothetical protein
VRLVRASDRRAGRGPGADASTSPGRGSRGRCDRIRSIGAQSASRWASQEGSHSAGRRERSRRPAVLGWSLRRPRGHSRSRDGRWPETRAWTPARRGRLTCIRKTKPEPRRGQPVFRAPSIETRLEYDLRSPARHSSGNQPTIPGHSTTWLVRNSRPSSPRTPRPTRRKSRRSPQGRARTSGRGCRRPSWAASAQGCLV